MHHPLYTFRRSYYDRHKLHQDFQIYHNEVTDKKTFLFLFEKAIPPSMDLNKDNVKAGLIFNLAEKLLTGPAYFDLEYFARTEFI